MSSKKRKYSETDHEKPHKRRKKDKKHNKKHLHCSSNDDNSDTSTSNQKPLPFNATPINHEKDYYIKNAEFRLWLFEIKKKYFENLSKKKSMKYFKKFVKKFNNNELPKKYYQGITPQSLESIQRTKHKWNFKITENDNMQMQLQKDSIDSMTNDINKIQEIKKIIEFEKIKKKNKQKKYKNNNNNHDNIYNNEMKKNNLKYQRKQYNKMNKLIEEELVPKKDGNERRIEIKRMKHRRITENDDREYDEFGDNGNQLDFSKFKERRRKMVENGKFGVDQGKLDEYRKKEKLKMEQFQKIIDDKRLNG